MTQIIPNDVQFHDSVTGQWSPNETQNSDRRRQNFDLDPSKQYVKVTVVGNITKQFPAESGVTNYQPNFAKETGTNGYPGFFVYQK